MIFLKDISEYYKKNQNAINVSLLIGLCLIVFHNILTAYFIEVDDFSSILHRKRGLLDMLLTNTKGSNTGGNYRPIESISHIIDTVLFGDDNTFGRHIVNLSIHILNTILVYFIVVHISKNKMIAFATSLIFAVHIIHSRSLPPVAWITGRSELALTFFFLLSIFLYAKALTKSSNILYVSSLLAFFFALLSKEFAVTLPIMILVYTLLYPENYGGRGIFYLGKSNLFFKILILIGTLLILSGAGFSPELLSRLVSSDNSLQNSTVSTINSLRVIAVLSGFVILILSIFTQIITKLLNKKYPYISSIWYSAPFFLVLIFFLALRNLIIGGFGGAYQSEGGNVFLQLGPDSFMRDIYSLASLIWPVSNEYNLEIFKLQVYQPVMFYSISIMVFLFLIYAFYRSVKSRSGVLIFGFLWLFIILIPAHNLMLNPWQTQSRYLYLPLVGFSLFLATAFYNLLQKINKYSYINAGLIIVFISMLVLSSVSIISYNGELRKGGNFMKTFITDMQKYKSQINDSTSFYFINFPSSAVNTMSNVYITAYMNDLLNYVDNYNGYKKKYDYHMLLFVNGEEKSGININWINDSSFVLNFINTSDYFLIPKELSELDLRIKEIYKRSPFHPIKKPLSGISLSELEFADLVKVSNYNDNNMFRIELKASPASSRNKSMFFIYKDGHFQLAKNTNTQKQLSLKLAGNLNLSKH